MSAYITFYIRSRSSGPYIALESFSRSSYIYQHMDVEYGVNRLLDMNDLCEAVDSMAAEIADYEQQLTEYQETIQFLQGVKGMDYNERLEHYSSIKMDMQRLREDIDNLKESMSHLRIYIEILETQQWIDDDCAAGDLYIAHECNPNYSKEKEND